ncbi:MAG TPA: hypothetical protein DCG49_03620 [Ruminococcus sp.]|nr:hypothetical protein [Ruminococcus sp.]
MNERDLLDAIGAVSDKTIEQTVLAPIKEAEQPQTEIEQIMTQQQPDAAAPQSVPETIPETKRKKIHFRAAAAVVAGCILLNAAIIFGIFKMNMRNEPLTSPPPASSSDSIEVQAQVVPYAEVLEDTASPIACTVLLHNPTNETITYGQSFHIYDQNGSECNRQTFTANRYDLPSGASAKLNCGYGNYFSESCTDDFPYGTPLAPGTYEIEVNFIASYTDEIIHARAPLVIPETYEGKVALTRPFFYGQPIDIGNLDRLLPYAVDVRIVAEPGTEQEYESAGTFHRIEPNCGLCDPFAVYPGNLQDANPEDYTWIDAGSTVTVYVGSGSQNEQILVLPDFRNWNPLYAVQYLRTAGVSVELKAGSDAAIAEDRIISSEPHSDETNFVQCTAGDTVVLTVNCAEDDLPDLSEIPQLPGHTAQDADIP